jgi:hypothetical protein
MQAMAHDAVKLASLTCHASAVLLVRCRSKEVDDPNVDLEVVQSAAVEQLRAPTQTVLATVNRHNICTPTEA